ncbi:MAG: hypothetical protein IPM21_00460 [Acidobacteria bacterium]|nr:hypothetical protein [Acidobacteriota bacterium]
MKCMMMLVLAFALLISFACGQKSPSAGPEAKKATEISQWQAVELKKWGIDGISLPAYLASEGDDSSLQENGEVTWTVYSKTWSSAPSKKGPKIASVELTVTDWNVPFSKVVPDMDAESATPENLLAVDLIGDQTRQQAENSLVEYADYHTIGDQRGALVQIRDFDNKDQIILIWQTLRYFNGKSQRIVLQVTAARVELPDAKKIVNSLKIEKEKI